MDGCFPKTIKFNKNNTTSWDAEVLFEAHLKNYNFNYINDFISAFRIHSESITGMGKNKKAVILQQSLYFERIVLLDFPNFSIHIYQSLISSILVHFFNISKDIEKHEKYMFFLFNEHRV